MSEMSISKLAFSSMMIPSIWVNSGRWVASMDSFLKILEMEKAFWGASGCSAMYLMLLTVLCVLRIAASAFSLDHVPPHPVDPVSPPFSWMFLISSTMSSSSMWMLAGPSR